MSIVMKYDCLRIHTETGIPVLFDVLHHELNNSDEGLKDAFALFTRTWEEEDGIPMVDYSQHLVPHKPGVPMQYLSGIVI